MRGNERSRQQESGTGRNRMLRQTRTAWTLIPALLLASLWLVRPAGAATITFSDQVGLSSAEISGVLSVPKFDPSLGNLVGVSWSITGAIATILGIQNDSSGSVTPSAFVDVAFDIGSAELSLGSSPGLSVLGSTGLVSLGAGETALFPITSQTVITGSEIPSLAFQLPGTVDLSFLTSTSFGGTGSGGDLTISQATDAGISFSITYEYNVIPEPSSLVLLGGGLMALAAGSRYTRSF
ncbi:MAG: choice-of-anchor E domain-containing protein [Myxococcota bacterium]